MFNVEPTMDISLGHPKNQCILFVLFSGNCNMFFSEFDRGLFEKCVKNTFLWWIRPGDVATRRLVGPP